MSGLMNSLPPAADEACAVLFLFVGVGLSKLVQQGGDRSKTP